MSTSVAVSQRRGSGRKGFTLVELLVVIGIIAVLISILLPSLAKARSAANKVACGSNMRQIGQMFAMYEAENKGKWPLSKNAGPVNWGDRNRYVCGAIWPHLLSPKGEPAALQEAANPDAYDNYVSAPRTFVCPAQAQDPDIQRTYILLGQLHWTPNDPNGWWNGDGSMYGATNTINLVYGNLPGPAGEQRCATARTPSKFRSSETIMMGEMRVNGPAWDWLNNNVQDKYHIGGNFGTARFDEFVRDDGGVWGPWAHDMAGANYLFCDGHVEYQQSPVRYHPGIWQGEFDNTTSGTQATVAWAKQFNVDKDACPNWGSGWWYAIPNP